MTGRGLIVAGLAAALAVAACTLTSGLSDYDAEDAVPDATAPLPDSGGGSGDGTTGIDSAAPSDGGTDGVSTAPFCKTAPANAIFCEDFEDNPESRWTPKTIGPSSIVRLATRPAGTGMALESIVAAESPQYRRASWTRALGNPPVLTHFRYSYGLYIEQRPAGGSYEVAVMALETGSEFCEFYLVVRDTGAAVGEQRCPTGSRAIELGLVLPTKKWMRLSFELNVASGAKTIQVLLDGAPALSSDLLHMAQGKPIPAVGITYANEPTIAGHVLMDDILLEPLP